MGMVRSEYIEHPFPQLGQENWDLTTHRSMFIAAMNYFKGRFAADPWILIHFQSAILSVFTAGNLASVLLLARLQANASYPKRIVASLLMNIIVPMLLALSTGDGLPARQYLGFVLAMAFLSSVATGLCQNGVFAYVGGFGKEEYMQGIMTGQAIAGVLPCVARTSLGYALELLWLQLS
jgi:equilibrative nucleoside transporter 1/2/3